MTIKEKLISVGVDIDKEKDLVNKAKEALKNADEKADKITTKLTIEGEKILNDLFKDKISHKKNVNRPKTLKTEETPIKDIEQETKKIKNDVKEDIQSEKKQNNENVQTDMSVPF